jgi:hypothetical protein
VAKNHAFIDGNKRVAFLSIGLFLAINGYRLLADQVDAVRVMLAVAAGELDEAALSAWISENMCSRQVTRPQKRETAAARTRPSGCKPPPPAGRGQIRHAAVAGLEPGVECCVPTARGSVSQVFFTENIEEVSSSIAIWWLGASVAAS